MGLLDFFTRRHTEPARTLVLVDIGTNAVTGAYAYLAPNALPTVLYTKSVPIKKHEGEATDTAMLRALKLLGETLIREGAPELGRTTGSGTAHTILVSIDAPWQTTTVHTEEFEEREPFVFTQDLVRQRLAERRAMFADKLLADESVVGTILNGYEMRNPYGKSVSRASAVILTSLIEREMATHILSTLQQLFHTRNVIPISGNSIRYQAVRDLFRHERDAIIVDITDIQTPSISLIRMGVFMSLVEKSATGHTWASVVAQELAEIGKQYPLPRTLFLLARDPEIATHGLKLDAPQFSSLWLSDSPPKIIPIAPSHLSGMVRQTTSGTPDIVTLLMALYFKNRQHSLEQA